MGLSLGPLRVTQELSHVQGGISGGQLVPQAFPGPSPSLFPLPTRTALADRISYLGFIFILQEYNMLKQGNKDKVHHPYLGNQLHCQQ